MALDVYPVTVRGPISTNSSGMVTFARLFEHEGRLYLAESRDKGFTVRRVTAYDLPEGAPKRPGRNSKWGKWVYTSCGCANRWNRWKKAELAAMVEGEEPESDSEPTLDFDSDPEPEGNTDETDPVSGPEEATSADPEE